MEGTHGCLLIKCKYRIESRIVKVSKGYLPKQKTVSLQYSKLHFTEEVSSDYQKPFDESYGKDSESLISNSNNIEIDDSFLKEEIKKDV